MIAEEEAARVKAEEDLAAATAAAIAKAKAQQAELAADQESAAKAKAEEEEAIAEAVVEAEAVAQVQAVLQEHALADGEWSEEAEQMHIAHVRTLLQQTYKTHAPEKLADVDLLLTQ